MGLKSSVAEGAWFKLTAAPCRVGVMEGEDGGRERYMWLEIRRSSVVLFTRKQPMHRYK